MDDRPFLESIIVSEIYKDKTGTVRCSIERSDVISDLCEPYVDGFQSVPIRSAQYFPILFSHAFMPFSYPLSDIS